MTQFVPHTAHPRKGFTALALAGLAVVGLGTLAATPAEAQRRPSAAALSWYGTYGYTELIPRGFGKDRMTATVEYRVAVNNRGCRISMVGLQVNTHMRCTARVNGSQLVVGFLSYADGGQLNEYGNRIYRPGQPLLTLQRNGRGLITHWQAIRPDDDRKPSGRYFRKIG